MKVSPATVTVPNRGAVVVLTATLSETTPLPVPVAPAVTVIQLVLLVAVRAQPAVPVTLIDTEPPAAPRFEYGGDMLNAPHTVDPCAAACVTVKVCPPIVIVPVRVVVRALAATLSDTVPLPVPVAPAVTVIQLALLVAVRAHPVVPVTVTDTGPPAAATLCDVGDRLNAPHTVPAWVTVKFCPAIVTEP